MYVQNCALAHSRHLFSTSHPFSKNHSWFLQILKWVVYMIMWWFKLFETVNQSSSKSNIMLEYALCSRNVQNVKLRIDFAKIWLFYRHSDFTWNQILVNSNGPKMSSLAILEVLNFDFSKSEPLTSPKFTSILSS